MAKHVHWAILTDFAERLVFQLTPQAGQAVPGRCTCAKDVQVVDLHPIFTVLLHFGIDPV